VPTCTDAQSFGVFDYTLTLAAEASCPADATCMTTSLDGEQLPFALIDCGKLTPTSCAATELSSGAYRGGRPINSSGASRYMASFSR
jgi:hypothetical protein